MDVGSILLILGLAGLVIAILSRPFYTHTANQRLIALPEEAQHKDHLRSSLLAEHERILSALQELEFDHVLGKIPAEDYPMQRAALLQKGAATLRQLDELMPSNSTLSAEDRIEALVAARRADASRGQTGPAADTGDPLENLIAARRREREEKTTGFCPKCGKPVQKSDRFCPRCGATVNA
ncbi:MAG TPA: zinc-ribbon domain-containing protein [Chloroflexi bacterium]|nr:zinc-ribbon domain-containing protein [Chloroflexota bacterium]